MLNLQKFSAAKNFVYIDKDLNFKGTSFMVVSK